MQMPSKIVELWQMIKIHFIFLFCRLMLLQRTLDMRLRFEQALWNCRYLFGQYLDVIFFFWPWRWSWLRVWWESLLEAHNCGLGVWLSFFAVYFNLCFGACHLLAVRISGRLGLNLKLHWDCKLQKSHNVVFCTEILSSASFTRFELDKKLVVN